MQTHFLWEPVSMNFIKKNKKKKNSSIHSSLIMEVKEAFVHFWPSVHFWPLVLCRRIRSE